MKINKSLAVVFLPLLLAVSCEKEKSVVKETYPDGSPKRICFYKGTEDYSGLVREISYYPGKKPQMEGEFKNGKRDGKWTFWYENGNKWSEGFFKDGKSEGKRTTYYENGKIRYEAFYRSDERVGTWRFYDENGKFLKEVKYSE